MNCLFVVSFTARIHLYYIHVSIQYMKFCSEFFRFIRRRDDAQNGRSHVGQHFKCYIDADTEAVFFN